MKIAAVFPGQGSQTVGMGKALAESFQVARDVFAEVDEALSQNLSALMWDGPIDELTLTANAQPALMAVSVAATRVLEQESGKSLAEIASYIAGHSLGEYSALAASGTLALSDAAKILRLRGEAMQAAVPAGQGAMAAVLGLRLEQVDEVARQAAEDEVCEIANDNAPGQVVISGSAAAIERAIGLAKEAGAKRSLALPVSAPFHCSLMQPAAERMAEALDDLSLNALQTPLVANVLAEAYQDTAQTKDLLMRQVTGRVRWTESVQAMAGNEVSHILELGAGKVLSGLNRRIDKSLASANMESHEQLDAVLELLKT